MTDFSFTNRPSLPSGTHGHHLWMVEVIAPFGGPEEMIKDLKAKVFPNEDIRTIALSKDGKKEVKVV